MHSIEYLELHKIPIYSIKLIQSQFSEHLLVYYKQGTFPRTGVRER